MHIIAASSQHMAALQDIVRQTWPVAYGDILSPAQIDYMIDRFYSTDALSRQMSEGQHFLLAFEQGAPAGFAGYEVNIEPSTTKLHKLYVLPQMQGKGIGRSLLNTVKQAAEKADQQRLILNVNRYNKAIHFYEKNGFSIAYTEDIDIGQGYFMNDYVMEIAIHPA